MQTELQYKAPGCAGGDCPARRKVTSAEGGYVIIGKRLSPADRAQDPRRRRRRGRRMGARRRDRAG